MNPSQFDRRQRYLKEKRKEKALEQQVFLKEQRIRKGSPQLRRTIKKNKNIGIYMHEAKGLPYSKFIKSRYWKLVRMWVRKRDGYKCTTCGSRVNLQVHHLTYKHHYREHLHLQDLTTLCRRHHEEQHIDLIRLKEVKQEIVENFQQFSRLV